MRLITTRLNHTFFFIIFLSHNHQTIATNQLVCNPKLMLFDLKRNGSLILRYDFPEDVASRGTNYLNKIVVDDANGDFAYITDNNGQDPGIVVYSRRINRSWKVRENSSMRANRDATTFAVNGTSLNFSIHIDGIALGPYYNPATGDVNLDATGSYSVTQNFERNVFYAPLSSYHLYSIPASRLRDPEFARKATPRQVLETVTDHGLKTSQVRKIYCSIVAFFSYSLCLFRVTE